MFRKIVCILSAAGLLLVFGVHVWAVEGTVLENLENGLYPAAAAWSELPNTGDYPAPIFTAMVISLGIVVLLIMTENHRK